MGKLKNTLRSSIQKNGIVGKEPGYVTIKGVKVKTSDLSRQMLQDIMHLPKGRDKS
jgi:hypothetical protein